MSAVNEFYRLTVELVELLEDKQVTDRDERILIIEDLLEKRETFAAGIHPPYTEQEQDIGIRTIELNNRLNELLSKEKMLIQKDMKDLSVKKQSSSKYANPYESLATDGMFYDKKK